MVEKVESTLLHWQVSLKCNSTLTHSTLYVVLAVSRDYSSIKAIFLLFIKVNKSSHIVNVFIRVFLLVLEKANAVDLRKDKVILWSFMCLYASSVLCWFTSADLSRDLVSRVIRSKMELSVSVQKGLRFLADPSVYDRTSFQGLVDASFRSLLSSHGDSSVLGEPSSPAWHRLCLLRYFRCFPA